MRGQTSEFALPFFREKKRKRVNSPSGTPIGLFDGTPHGLKLSTTVKCDISCHIIKQPGDITDILCKNCYKIWNNSSSSINWCDFVRLLVPTAKICQLRQVVSQFERSFLVLEKTWTKEPNFKISAQVQSFYTMWEKSIKNLTLNHFFNQRKIWSKNSLPVCFHGVEDACKSFWQPVK